ncbi:hypothetical protein BAG01nite_13150 [Brevibacillus agri]|uniref:Uncharacterized protein n=1 Tax=Brevibacillus agri TaxID=51101 RepID=A0ABQ0SNK3_9BACL|nr:MULTISPECIES: hypothetical protein [Brevibacillus]ELK43277.1 hypothetical protein D478_04486 [Brevibacillus agri BAB-2500]EJL41877.1 hypothetical protein PMI08_03465 [Brevibacillus sp. CF112]MBY0051858.1 hypothetical protein [Brevibacillus agri]MCG5251571.1 hypothetical protein [Brevibacillus agri]MDN4094151.1 hypothetical protein [Brevibacillus agri]
MNQPNLNQFDEAAQGVTEFPVMGTSLNPFDETWGTFASAKPLTEQDGAAE